MKKRLPTLLALAGALFATAAGAADFRPVAQPMAAQSMPMAAQPVRAALVPACDDPRVLAQIEDQFEYGAPRVERTVAAVAQFAGLFERAYFPSGGNREIERRYCQGQALVAGAVWSDAKGPSPYTTVYYVVEHPMGYASLGWRAEGCFLGFDRWKVYGANCESLRRF